MNIIEVFERFPNQESCIAHLEAARWHGEPTCPYCGSTNTAKSEHRHRCYDCKTGFSVTVGTIFHRTHPPPSEVVSGDHADAERPQGAVGSPAFPRSQGQQEHGMADHDADPQGDDPSRASHPSDGHRRNGRDLHRRKAPQRHQRRRPDGTHRAAGAPRRLPWLALSSAAGR